MYNSPLPGVTERLVGAEGAVRAVCGKDVMKCPLPIPPLNCEKLDSTIEKLNKPINKILRLYNLFFLIFKSLASQKKTII